MFDLSKCITVCHSFEYLKVHSNLSHMYSKIKTSIYGLIGVSTCRTFCIKLTFCFNKFNILLCSLYQTFWSGKFFCPAS